MIFHVINAFYWSESLSRFIVHRKSRPSDRAWNSPPHKMRIQITSNEAYARYEKKAAQSLMSQKFSNKDAKKEKRSTSSIIDYHTELYHCANESVSSLHGKLF